MKKYLLLFTFCLALAFQAFAQTAGEMDAILASQGVSYDQAARFVLQAADVANLSSSEAFSFTQEQKWLPASASSGEQARLDSLSLLIMRAFEMKGGLLYSVTKSPHYAYRELMYKGIIVGRVDPHMAVSGEELLFILGRVLSGTEDA